MGNESQNTVFLPEGSKRERGKDAQRMNIMVAKAVSNAVKSTLGLRNGQDASWWVGECHNQQWRCNNFKEMAIEHPIGKMLVELAKPRWWSRDGTTSAVIAGGLVAKAENLLDENVHPSIIIKGYRWLQKKQLSIFEISEGCNQCKQELLDIAKPQWLARHQNIAQILVTLFLKQL